MSIGTFRIVDPDNLASVLFDMNDIAGTSGNAGGVKTQTRELRLNAPELRAVRFSPEASPGASTPFAKDELAGMSWRQRIFGYADTDKASEGLGRLDQLLRLGGVIEWLPTGAALTKYINFESSASAPLFGETERDVFYATQLKDYPEGILIQVLRQPYLRSGELDPAVNQLTNASLLLDTGLTGPPNSWTWTSEVSISNQRIDEAAESYRFDIATSATRSLQQTTPPASAAPGDRWTASFYAKASAGNARARVVIEYLDSSGTPLASYPGTTTPLTTAWQRLSVTTDPAPANTDRIRVSLENLNSDSVSVTCWFRFAQLEHATALSLFRLGAETVSNDPAAAIGRVTPLYVEGTAPAPVKVRAKVEAGAKLRDILIASAPSDGITGRRALADFLNSLKYAQCEATGNGWTVALSGDTSSVADAAASGGNVAETSYASNPTIMAKRARLSRTSKLAALRGTFDVYVRAKVVAASKHTVQLRWTPSLADPVAFSEAEVTLDKTGLTLFQYELVPLGTVHMPHNLSNQVGLAGIALELWSRRDSGSGALRWDFIAFVPA
ncbi:MAG: phage head spike fiber domain-containing protein, partial [Actinomycetota bacterium]